MNWQITIQELLDTGLTQSEIAIRCGTGQSHICALLNGHRKSPNWQLGENIRRLHRRVVKKAA